MKITFYQITKSRKFKCVNNAEFSRSIKSRHLKKMQLTKPNHFFQFFAGYLEPFLKDSTFFAWLFTLFLKDARFARILSNIAISSDSPKATNFD